MHQGEKVKENVKEDEEEQERKEHVVRVSDEVRAIAQRFRANAARVAQRKKEDDEIKKAFARSGGKREQQRGRKSEHQEFDGREDRKEKKRYDVPLSFPFWEKKSNIIKKILNGNSSNNLLKRFEKLNSTINVNIEDLFVDQKNNLSSFEGKITIANNKVNSAKIESLLNKENNFSLNINTNSKDEKITNLFIENPEPFIKNYKFIKGFNEGKLSYGAIEKNNKTKANLKIYDFKVKEVPVLAKILTLASLQGIADLLTGEGIRFNEFEMDYESEKSLTTINEMYAIGPAISILMEGYIEKDKLTSLRGTLVPATTINKTISKIPLLGDILVGKKVGEGVFGVSFKIKGPPKDLNTSVNPIKTLTPRFITRTLEKLKKN